MFGRDGDDAAAVTAGSQRVPGGALDGDVVAFRGSRGEHHFARLGAD